MTVREPMSDWAKETARCVGDQAKDEAFSKWLDELEAIMREWDAKHGNLPYELPFDRSSDNGNICCWRDYFDDEMTAQEAFDSDQSYWGDF